MVSIGNDSVRAQVRTRIKAKNSRRCPFSHPLENSFGRRRLEAVIAKICRAMLAKSRVCTSSSV
eukprot:11174572-Lingulodinium_polyedra.AAC.1